MSWSSNDGDRRRWGQRWQTLAVGVADEHADSDYLI